MLTPVELYTWIMTLESFFKPRQNMRECVCVCVCVCFCERKSQFPTKVGASSIRGDCGSSKDEVKFGCCTFYYLPLSTPAAFSPSGSCEARIVQLLFVKSTFLSSSFYARFQDEAGPPRRRYEHKKGQGVYAFYHWAWFCAFGVPSRARQECVLVMVFTTGGWPGTLDQGRSPH